MLPRSAARCSVVAGTSIVVRPCIATKSLLRRDAERRDSFVVTDIEIRAALDERCQGVMQKIVRSRAIDRGVSVIVARVDVRPTADEKPYPLGLSVRGQGIIEQADGMQGRHASVAAGVHVRASVEEPDSQVHSIVTYGSLQQGQAPSDLLVPVHPCGFQELGRSWASRKAGLEDGRLERVDIGFLLIRILAAASDVRTPNAVTSASVRSPARGSSFAENHNASASNLANPGGIRHTRHDDRAQGKAARERGYRGV
jgi:hypothetical protein